MNIFIFAFSIYNMVSYLISTHYIINAHEISQQCTPNQGHQEKKNREILTIKRNITFLWQIHSFQRKGSDAMQNTYVTHKYLYSQT